MPHISTKIAAHFANTAAVYAARVTLALLLYIAAARDDTSRETDDFIF